MSAPEYDPEFEAYLRRRVRFDRRLPRSLTHLEPPEELDRIIIGKARAAIQPLPVAPVFRAPRWAAPLAMAASLLVSFALMLDVGLRQAVHHDALRAPMLVEISQEPPAQAENSIPGAPLAAAAPAPAEAAPVSPATRLIHPKAQLARSAGEAVARRTDPPASARTAAANMAPVAADTSQPATPSVPVTASALTTADVADRTAAHGGGGEMGPPRYAGRRYAPIRLAMAGSEMETVVVIGQRRLIQVAAMSPIAAISVDAMTDLPRSETVAIPIPDLPSTLLGGGSGSASPMAAAERREHPDPKAWLDRIEKMQAAGLSSAADQELKLFRDAYPAYPVPSESHPADGGVQ